MTIPPDAVKAAREAFTRHERAPPFPPALDAALLAVAPFIRARLIEECAKVAEGWPCEAAGQEYQTSGNGNFWDAGTMYDQGRIDAASNIRALILAETKETT